MLTTFFQKRAIKTAVLTATVISFLSHPHLVRTTYAQNFSNEDVSSSEIVSIRLSDEDWNAVARVAEKVIRANGLDENTWRIVVANKYHDNAYATDANLVVIFSGLLEKIRGDDAALAFVIGHELGHHIKRHIAVGASTQKEIKAKLTAEAEAEITQLLVEERQKYNNTRNANTAVNIFCGLTRVCNSGTGNLAAMGVLLLANDGRPDPQKVEQKKQEIIAKKQQEHLAKTRELNHRQEFEADELGYKYMAKAGYDVKGGFRVMNILGRIPGAETVSDTHPRISDRVEALNSLMVKYPSQSLAAEGTAKLRSSKRLTFDISKDNNSSLLINSRFSSK